jgi:uncharacterized RDD family membrane protein YckC
MQPPSTDQFLYCSQCGQPKAELELAKFGDILVCGGCKPAYAQRLREGIAPLGTFHYAGFWIRLLAAFIDGIILGFASAAVQAILFPSLMKPSFSTADASVNMALIGLAYLLGLTIGAAYEGLFISRLGATPGKLVLKLKVVRPDGGKISLGRAIARYFAKMLSAIILGIGYIMAGFDKEKRALHDMIADTRVIKARS